MKLVLLSFFLLTSMAFAKDKKPKKEIPTTEERAESMFRKPSSKEKGKIKDKFQPIDHKIKTDR